MDKSSDEEVKNKNKSSRKPCVLSLKDGPYLFLKDKSSWEGKVVHLMIVWKRVIQESLSCLSNKMLAPKLPENYPQLESALGPNKTGLQRLGENHEEVRWL